MYPSPLPVWMVKLRSWKLPPNTCDTLHLAALGWSGVPAFTWTLLARESSTAGSRPSAGAYVSTCSRAASSLSNSGLTWYSITPPSYLASNR